MLAKKIILSNRNYLFLAQDSYLEPLPEFQSLGSGICITYSETEASMKSSTGDDVVFQNSRVPSLMSVKTEKTNTS